MIDLDKYGLVSSTSIYDEDNLTARQLLIKTARQMVKCIEYVEELIKLSENVEPTTTLDYDELNEGLSVGEYVGLKVKLSGIKRTLTFLYNENSVSPIELASNINKYVNECLTGLESVVATLLDKIPELDLTAVKTAIDDAWVCIYDECGYTTLQLAGITANNVNGLIDILNSLRDIYIPLPYDPEAIALSGLIENENLII